MKLLMVILLFLFGLANAQNMLELNIAEYERGVISANGIVDLLTIDNDTWIANGGGLDYTTDMGRNFVSYTVDDFGGKGGAVSILQTTDAAIWISIGDDSTINDLSEQVGEGLAYTFDDGLTWDYIPQPVDPNVETDGGYSDSLGYWPTTTRVRNITFDLGQTDNYIWIASWGGGLRRAAWPQNKPQDYSFEVHTTNGQPFNALGDLSHRVFSIAAIGQFVAVGSAEGVAISYDEGENWAASSFNSEVDNSLPANFIVSLNYFAEDSSMWAGCIETGIPGEERGLGISRNGGLSWEHVLNGKWIYSVTKIQGVVMAGTDDGLYLSYDDGKNWVFSGSVEDFETGEFFTTSKVYSISGDEFGAALWLGTPDGLALRDGNLWRIFRKFSPAGIDGEVAAYAYPNPYSPDRKDFVRFQIRMENSGNARIGIYNFAMEKVIEISENITANAEHPDRSIKWNGKDSDGNTVVNGVYFFRAQTPDGITWGKLVIIN